MDKMTLDQANDAYNKAFPDSTGWLDLGWSPRMATLDGDFSPEQLRMIADLLEALAA